MNLEWQRTSVAAPPVDDPGEPRLVALIRDEISEHGPITFARFMERSLYEPELGYYATSTQRPTPSGDFVTAPELHPVFGWALARQIDQMWRRLGSPTDFTMREYGAGSGALALSVLDGLARAESALAATIRYQPVDLPAQVDVIGQRLAAAGHDDRLVPVGASLSGVVVANEFLDALPVHRVEQRDGRLQELYIGLGDDGFIEVTGELSDECLARWFRDAGVTLAEGQRAEVNLGLLDWVEAVARDLERGFVIAIDYGAGPAELYGPARMRGSVRAFAGQHVSSDVLRGVGRRDLTAHVDFGALERRAKAVGVDVLGRRRLNEFLLAVGLDDAYAAARAEADRAWDSAVMLRASVRRLLDPRALGGYQVALLGKAAPTEPKLSGLEPLARAGDAR